MEEFKTPKTEKDYIEETLFKASISNPNNTNPYIKNLEELGDELYENLFGYRDKLGETPLNRPVKFSLIEVFKELKFGRIIKDQEFLNKCITEIMRQDAIEKVEEILKNNNVVGYEIKSNDDGSFDIKGQIIINK